MEATREGGLLEEIRPPRLEDAGLEDCALPPDSIKEAFLKAASAVSRASSIFTSDEPPQDRGCTGDTWHPGDGWSDDLVGITEGVDSAPGACEGEKGWSLPAAAVGGDVVVVPEAEEEKAAVGGGDVPEGDCVDDGLKGLEIEEKGKGTKEKNNGDEDKDEERPILTEGFLV